MWPKKNFVFLGIVLLIAVQDTLAQQTETINDVIENGIINENDKSHLFRMLKSLDEYQLDDEMKLQALRNEIKNSLDNTLCPKGVCKKKRCRASHKPRRRYFTFIVEEHFTMGPGCGACKDDTDDCFKKHCVSADGKQRLVITVNGKMPGPTVQVCRGDTVIVDVINKVPGSELTIHWHGITQKGTPYMDGVPFITQCAIGEGRLFRYEFVASEMGTHLWYAQRGTNHADGVVGSLIVRCAEDPWGWLYDDDKYIIMLQDWFSSYPARSKIPGSTDPSMQGVIPDSLLINGRGQFWDAMYRGFNNDSMENRANKDAPLARFYVQKHENQRLRLVHAGSLACPLHFQIDEHDLFIIAADGNAIRPVTVNSIVLLPGERYDVIISARKPVDSYWIRVKALGRCAPFKLYQLAVLIYEGAATEIPTKDDPGYDDLDPGRVLNPLNDKCIGCRTNRKGRSASSSETHEYNEDYICAYELRSLKKIKLHLTQDSGSRDSRAETGGPDDDTRHSEPRKHIKFELNFGEHIYKAKDIYASHIRDTDLYYTDDGDANAYEAYAGEFNGVSLAYPSALLLGHPEVYTESRHLHCRKTSRHQTCLHTLHANKGDLVDIILHHKREAPCDDTPHSFHLHGHQFELLYQGGKLSEAKDSRKFCKHPSFRDTVVVPAGGVARIRFSADNPGLWLLNSQLMVHQLTGMSIIISVGSTKELPPKPKHFPMCNDFKPPMRLLRPPRSSSESSSSSKSSSSDSSDNSS